VVDVLYVLLAYWPYLAGVFAVGLGVGWWAEASRGREAVWLERRPDKP
jgi:hypothetical protein